jgi:hypothetical protein
MLLIMASDKRNHPQGGRMPPFSKTKTALLALWLLGAVAFLPVDLFWAIFTAVDCVIDPVLCVWK